MRKKAGILKNQRGATLIVVAVSMVVIFGFAVLAIDISMMLLARTQLKNAADSAALAGASALVDGDVAAATEQAIRFAGLNVAVQDTLSPVVITEEDVWFPDNNTITVRTHRTVATNDPVSLFFLRVINSASDNKGSVTATSRASVSQVCATDCVKPWCPPDRWEEVDTNGIFEPDKGEWYDKVQTGYSASRNLGQQITLYQNSAPKWEAEWYYAIDFPPINKGDPITGAKTYEKYIKFCEPYLIEVGDLVQLEPGAMKGPTRDGLEYLYYLDEFAYWEDDEIKGSAFAVSPRIIKVSLFDPALGVQTDAIGRKYVTVSNIMVVFIEDYEGSDIVGRFMRLATQGESCDDPGSFMYKVALVPGPEEE